MNKIAAVSQASHLLLVDDDLLILSTMSSGLRAVGYRVSTADSAEEAEALLTAGTRPDMAILDVHLPNVDGLTLAERLHEFEHLPFVMLSAYGDAKSVAAATRSGALAYMVKPIDVPQMVPTLEAALLRARELRALQFRTEQLQGALAAERVVNVAVGITMMQHRLGRQAAFDLLRSAARNQRIKIADLALVVVENHETVFGK